MSIFKYNHKHYNLFKKIFLWISGIILFFALFFGYTSNIEVDEASEKLIKALDVLAIVFYVLSAFAIAAIVYYIIEGRREYKEVYAHRNRRKVHIYPFDVINFTWMALFCVCCIYPMLYVIVGSFNQGADYSKGGVYLIPRIFTFENYRIVLNKPDLWSSYGVTFARTIIGTVTALVFTSIVAYAMSRDNLKFKNVFYWINIFTMFFGGGLVPYFLIVKLLGLYNTFLVYIIPGLYSVYNMIVIQSFFRTVSNELHEAALVDGAGEFRIWWQIYMPLSKPILATVALWLAVGHWNAYFDTMIYTSDSSLQTLQYFLLKAIQTSTLTEGLPSTMMEKISAKTISMAAIIITVIPVLFFFPFVRKNFQSGIMIGSLKG